MGETEHRYLLRTLRLQVGAPVTLFTGLDEGEWQTALSTLAPAQLEVLAFSVTRPESPLSITLVQGVAKADAMELAVQKAVELGVARIIPLLCQRSASNAGGALTDNRQRRLRRIAVEAAEQSGRIRVPEVTDPLSWKQLATHLPPGPRLLFWEQAGQQPRLPSLAEPGSTLTLLVGPEGGLEPHEESFARDGLGFVTLGMGPRILRTETAALAAVAACQLLWGDMR
ncbi:MAG: 16S rRNA (uracil(1498)-N(3))-methyltransferase [Magnetococcus sp. YQC-3]